MVSDEYNSKYKSIQHSEAAVTLEDETTHFDSLAIPSDRTDLWEETALGVVAECGDYDVLLWAAGYVLFGNGKGLWGPGKSAEREIQLIVVPKSQRGRMSDNDFVRVGWTPTERLRGDQIKVVAADDAITWDFNGLRFVSQPPQWRLEGLSRRCRIRSHVPPEWCPAVELGAVHQGARTGSRRIRRLRHRGRHYPNLCS
ncbi:hypothetical protein [Nocardia sp. NPDC047038]|uniref:hypothetical protein n=1 Tax=Nocardia sp. NPDC047038 TaxID=3154338 RepID=UPI0033C706F3